MTETKKEKTLEFIRRMIMLGVSPNVAAQSVSSMIVSENLFDEEEICSTPATPSTKGC